MEVRLKSNPATTGSRLGDCGKDAQAWRPPQELPEKISCKLERKG